MNPIRILGIVLIAAGALALTYGGFSYTKETHHASVGPVEFSVADNRTVNVPAWAGIGAMLVGGVLLFLRGQSR